MTALERLIAALNPLRWVLYAYVSHREDMIDTMATLLGITQHPADAAQAWELYISEANTANEAMEADDPLMRLHQAFDLDAYMRFMVSLSLADELLPEFHAALNMLGGCTPGLTLPMFSSSREEAVCWQTGVLRRERTMRLMFDSFGTDAPLRLRRSVKGYVLGFAVPPGYCELWLPEDLPEPLTACDLPQLIDAQLKIKPSGNLFVISGAKGAGRKYQLRRYLHTYGGGAFVLRYDDIPDDIIHLYELEALLALTDYVLCISDVPGDKPPSKLYALIRAVRPPNVFVIAESESVQPPEDFAALPLPIPPLSQRESADIWRACMEKAPFCEEPERLAAQYRFTIGQIISSWKTVCETAMRSGLESVNSAALHEACKRQLSHHLEKLAKRVPAGCSWDDIILPPPQKRLLRHVCDCVRWSGKVYEEWGMDAKAAYGRGVRALFSGPPGTGKTMAARVIAAELDMELFKIDVSSLVSKYIGETEKNLNEVFAEAEKSGGILFFDEADAIFGKRGEQKDSHDRYANMQTAFLLQRFEDYDGVVLLATNLMSNLDPAFMRRIQVRVEFPLPDYERRKAIWRQMLDGSGKTPLDSDIDLDFLADRFELTGSDIRGVTLTSAFLAASRGGKIGMREIVQALTMEYGKKDKVLTGRELGEYAEGMG